MIFHGVLCTSLRDSCSLKFAKLNKDTLSIIKNVSISASAVYNSGLFKIHTRAGTLR